eukprot:gene5111-5473_t
MSNVAHDLKTPLASFMSGIEILKEDLQQCESSFLIDNVSETLSSTSRSFTTIESYEDDSDNFRVLLAEDTPSMTKLIKKLLEKQGYRVDVAENGLVCFNMFQESIDELTGKKPQILPSTYKPLSPTIS